MEAGAKAPCGSAARPGTAPGIFPDCSVGQWVSCVVCKAAEPNQRCSCCAHGALVIKKIASYSLLAESAVAVQCSSAGCSGRVSDTRDVGYSLFSLGTSPSE